MVRWWLTLCAVLVVALVWWWLLSPGLGEGQAAGQLATPIAKMGRGPQPELRIEIRETAAGAQASYRIILARYSDDPRARAWIAECVAAKIPDSTAGPVNQDLLHACWRAYADEADAMD